MDFACDFTAKVCAPSSINGLHGVPQIDQVEVKIGATNTYMDVRLTAVLRILLPDYQSVHVEADLRETKKRLGTHAQLPKLNSCYKFPAVLFTRLRLLRRAARFKRRMVNLTLKPSPNPLLAQKGKRLKVGCRRKSIFFPER